MPESIWDISHLNHHSLGAVVLLCETFLFEMYIPSFKSPEAPEGSGSLETTKARMRASLAVVGIDSQEGFTGVLGFSLWVSSHQACLRSHEEEKTVKVTCL